MVREPIEPIATVVTISIQALRSQDFITFRDGLFPPNKNIQDVEPPPQNMTLKNNRTSESMTGCLRFFFVVFFSDARVGFLWVFYMDFMGCLDGRIRCLKPWTGTQNLPGFDSQDFSTDYLEDGLPGLGYVVSNHGDVSKSPKDRVMGPLINGLFMAYKWG